MQSSESVSGATAAIVRRIKAQMIPRGFKAAQQLYNSTQIVLSGIRSGRIYRIPNTVRRYTASAPGEAPAVRTGTFRASFHPTVETEENNGLTIHSQAKSGLSVSGYLLGSILDEGTARMEARPFKDKVKERAAPEIRKIFSVPYE
ncbi:hypothetical protein [Caproicibacterium sp. XB1]|uniref:hypothetical protein n=1 Tax=Caproicibacterium sp. XB1 TaxID=3396405 RepID=UPI0039B70099